MQLDYLSPSSNPSTPQASVRNESVNVRTPRTGMVSARRILFAPQSPQAAQQNVTTPPPIERREESTRRRFSTLENIDSLFSHRIRDLCQASPSSVNGSEYNRRRIADLGQGRSPDLRG